MSKKCTECQFEESKHGTYEYIPHAPGCSKRFNNSKAKLEKILSVDQKDDVACENLNPHADHKEETIVPKGKFSGHGIKIVEKKRITVPEVYAYEAGRKQGFEEGVRASKAVFEELDAWGYEEVIRDALDKLLQEEK